MPSKKPLPKIAYSSPVSGINSSSNNFWFSDDVRDYYSSAKSSMKLRRRLDEFREHENNVKDFKRKMG